MSEIINLSSQVRRWMTLESQMWFCMNFTSGVFSIRTLMPTYGNKLWYKILLVNYLLKFLVF